MAGVSLASLESVTSTRPRLHPWLEEAGSWLPAGLSFAAELAIKPDLESVSRLLDLCRGGLVGDPERQRVFGLLGKVLIEVIDAWDGSQEEKPVIDNVNKDIWDAQKCGAVDLNVQVLSRVLNFSEDMFVIECEGLIICSLEDEVSEFVNSPLLKVLPHDVGLFQKFLRVFSTLFDTIEINAKMLKTFRKLCHIILERAENPILLFPLKHRSLVCRLYSGNEMVNKIYPSDSELSSIDPDVKLLSLLFDCN